MKHLLQIRTIHLKLKNWFVKVMEVEKENEKRLQVQDLNYLEILESIPMGLKREERKMKDLVVEGLKNLALKCKCILLLLLLRLEFYHLEGLGNLNKEKMLDPICNKDE